MAAARSDAHTASGVNTDSCCSRWPKGSRARNTPEWQRTATKRKPPHHASDFVVSMAVQQRRHSAHGTAPKPDAADAALLPQVGHYCGEVVHLICTQCDPLAVR